MSTIQTLREQRSIVADKHKRAVKKEQKLQEELDAIDFRIRKHYRQRTLTTRFDRKYKNRYK